MAQSRSLFMFIFVFSTRYNLNWKKRRWCAWDSNPGWQDGRRERIHRAMAAPQLKLVRLGCNEASGLIKLGEFIKHLLLPKFDIFQRSLAQAFAKTLPSLFQLLDVSKCQSLVLKSLKTTTTLCCSCCCSLF